MRKYPEKTLMNHGNPIAKRSQINLKFTNPGSDLRNLRQKISYPAAGIMETLRIRNS